jgi:hypothetical protein
VNRWTEGLTPTSEHFSCWGQRSSSSHCRNWQIQVPVPVNESNPSEKVSSQLVEACGRGWKKKKTYEIGASCASGVGKPEGKLALLPAPVPFIFSSSTSMRYTALSALDFLLFPFFSSCSSFLPVFMFTKHQASVMYQSVSRVCYTHIRVLTHVLAAILFFRKNDPCLLC